MKEDGSSDGGAGASGKNTGPWRRTAGCKPRLHLPGPGPSPVVVKCWESGKGPGLEASSHHVAAKICLRFRLHLENEGDDNSVSQQSGMG